jgi:GNAT superfamily N-acetyltransferase
MPFNYKQLVLRDLALAQRVGRETYEPYYRQIWKSGGLDWYMERCFGTETLSAELQDPNIEYWLAEDEAAQTIGFLKLLLQKPIPDHPIKNALYLEKVYLMPAFFRKGAGQHLIEFAKQRASKLGQAAVWLTVMENGPVWSYELAGFQPTGVVHWDFELLKETERNGVVMTFLIDPA